MTYPPTFKYTKDHAWIDVTGDRGAIGITDHAREQLGDIAFVELPADGTMIFEGQPFGMIESSTAAAELYAPVSGEVVDVNSFLEANPGRLNTDPYGNWLIVVRLSRASEVDGLLDASEYADLVK